MPQPGRDQPQRQCPAYGCAESPQLGGDYCQRHAHLVYEIQCWMDGWTPQGRVPRSFDAEREAWASSPGSYTK